MYFDVRAPGNKSTRDRTLIKLLRSPPIVASGISNTIFLSSDPDELCERLKILLQEIKAGNNSNKINVQVIAIVDKLLENKCVTKKQHKQKQNLSVIYHTNKTKYKCMYTMFMHKRLN